MNETGTRGSTGIDSSISPPSGVAIFRRISGFSAPNNLVADAAALLAKAEGGEAPLPIFDYRDNAISIGEPSPGVRIDARTPASYVWSPDDGGYLRFQGTAAHETRETERQSSVFSEAR